MSVHLRGSCLFILVLFIPSVSAVSQSNDSPKFPPYPHLISAQEPQRKAASRLSKPLIGDDGKVYICLEKSLLAFESNGSIAWTIPLNYTCNVGITPVHGGSRKIYLVAENRVLKINTLNIGTSGSAGEVFFGPEPGGGLDEIIGLSVSTSSSCVLVNLKRRGLFALSLHGKLRWSTGPTIYRLGYRQGCRKNVTDCYFTSVPVIDHCEASIYVSNNQGELYALSVRSPHFKWIQDFSSLDKIFTVTAGNNGQLYVTVPAKTLVLALDVSTGTVLWQNSIGPLSTKDSAPVADINGWISISSLDGFLYSFSPTGILKKFPKTATMDTVVQVNPVLDCSGYAVYISQTKVEGKITRTIGDYTSVSAMKPVNAIFTILVPATGSVYWSESYLGHYSSLLSESDLRRFVLDESVLLAFFAVSNAGNPLPCQSTRQKLALSCSLASPKHVSIYTGNERAILLFLLFESLVLVVLAALVRFCCVFWRKKKLQGQKLGQFLEKRRFLRFQKKAFDRTITELEQKATEESAANEELAKLGDLVRQREGIERKLSTTYSLGRDIAGPRSKSLLPLYNGKSRSFSFQNAKKESVTIFHTLSNSTSSEDSSSKDKQLTVKARAKGKAPIEIESSSDDGSYESEYEAREFMKPLYIENDTRGVKIFDERDAREVVESGSRSIRRRALSSSN